MKTTIQIGKIETCNIHPTSKYLIRKDCLLEKENFLITIWKSREALY